MSLNYWKLGGQPTSYSPLSGSPFVPVLPNTDYVLTLYARSASNGRLQLNTQGVGLAIQSLISQRTFYTFNLKPTQTQLYFTDLDSKGDIIIDSIELVQKPLPKLTLNGVDGFSSGKWIIHPRATVLDDTTLSTDATDAWQSTALYNVPVIGGKSYYFSAYVTSSGGAQSGLLIGWYDANGTNLNPGNSWGCVSTSSAEVMVTGSLTAPNTAVRASILVSSPASGVFKVRQPVMNLGSLVPYSRKTGDKMVLPVAKGNGAYQVNKLPKKPIVKARTGLSFNGVSDYLQLPSMTMDSVEIDCLIDSASLSKYIIDARPGLANGYLWTDGLGNDQTGTGFSSVFVNGVSKVGIYSSLNLPLNQRIKIKLNTSAPFTETIPIWGKTGAGKKGTLYKVTCYLNNQIVAQYDFEKPSNIVGTSVLQNANNLIPNFEDARWNLHANTQVLGKHYLRLNATASSNVSYSTINVSPNTNFIFTNTTNGYCCVANADGSINLLGWSSLPSRTFNSGSNSVIRIYCGNYNGVFVSGTFEFSKPQLYALSGTEGTLNGTPISARKQSRRTQYAKR
jgi:hypothetical protein